MKRQELLRRVGCIDQLAGVRRFSFTSGRRDGIRGYEVYNMGGLHFTVMESRCLDIFNLWYKGIPFGFVSKPGMVAAPYADLHGPNFLRSAGAGMLYTCGLTNAGTAFQEEGVDDIFHGRIRFIPPENCGCYEGWEDDDYVLKIRGEMRDARLFGEHLVLSRIISTSLESRTIVIDDVIENRGFEEQEYLVLYHFNIGYPVMEKGCKIYLPSASCRPMNGAAEKLKGEWNEISDPIDGSIENVFTHKLMRDRDGRVYCGLWNENKKLGIAFSFDFSVLDYIVEWKSMGSGDYVFGFLAANNHGAGRGFERANGTVKHIKAFEQVKNRLTMDILDGDEDLAKFVERYEGCTLP